MSSSASKYEIKHVLLAVAQSRRLPGALLLLSHVMSHMMGHVMRHSSYARSRGSSRVITIAPAMLAVS